MRMTANTFGIARCTVGVVVHEICSILSNDIAKILIHFPQQKKDVTKIAQQFIDRFGFPQVIGCIDGTHIPIKQPTENAHDYFSYKMFYSVNCQAICNAFGRFTNVEVRWPGSVHDARVFANCEIQTAFSKGNFDLYYKELLPGHECVPQLLLGDPAYPLLPYVIKEYNSCGSNEQVVFNQMLRSARNQIECAFGRLKARWRILCRPIDVPIAYVPNIILSCFALHNFCELHNVEVDQTLVNKIISEEHRIAKKVDRINTYTTSKGAKVRDSITDSFKEYM